VKEKMSILIQNYKNKSDTMMFIVVVAIASRIIMDTQIENGYVQ